MCIVSDLSIRFRTVHIFRNFTILIIIFHINLKSLLELLYLLNAPSFFFNTGSIDIVVMFVHLRRCFCINKNCYFFPILSMKFKTFTEFSMFISFPFSFQTLIKYCLNLLIFDQFLKMSFFEIFDLLNSFRATYMLSNLFVVQSIFSYCLLKFFYFIIFLPFVSFKIFVQYCFKFRIIHQFF